MKWHSIILVTLCIFASVGLSMAATIDVGDEFPLKTIQAGVNAASAGDTVLVHAGTYNIDSSIMAKSGVTIKGEGEKSIIYTDDFDDISDSENMAMIYVNGVSDVEICDLSFVGPAEDSSDQHSNGGTSLGALREARNAVMVRGSSNINIHDIYVKLILSDGVRISNSNNVSVRDSVFNSAGHDSVSIFKSSGVVIDNCYMDVMINTCVRYDGAEDCILSNSTFIQTVSGTGAGFIELEHSVNNVKIRNNAFLETEDPVIWTIYEEGGYIEITDNALYKNSGISSSYSPFNVVIKDNIQFATLRNWKELGYGYSENVDSVIEVDTSVETPIDTYNNTKGAALQMTATLENSVTDLQFNYAENINDGRGITFGCIGFCTGTYDGNILIKHYTELNPDNTLAKYIPALDKIDAGPHDAAGGDGNPNIEGLEGFIEAVQACEDPLFKQAQLDMLDELYWNPAMKLCDEAGATMPLTQAYVYDMSVRHGPDSAKEIMQKAGSIENYSNETEYLAQLITLRNAELQKEGLGDVDRNAGYIIVLDSANYDLKTPYTFTAYGEEFTITGNLGVDIGEVLEPTVTPSEGNSSTSKDCNDCISENCSNECLPTNCTESENCTVTLNVNSTVLTNMQDIARAYLNLNTENLNVSISLMQSGNNDTVKASELINGTAEEQLLSTRMLESSKIKLKCAQDLLNLSIENIEIAEYLVNQNCSSAE